MINVKPLYKNAVVNKEKGLVSPPFMENKMKGEKNG